MGNKTENKRICKFCGVEFFLTSSQEKQVKKATYCSRSCARKHQHSKNHKNKRHNVTCPICKKVFTKIDWQGDRKFCSQKCAATARFGEKNISKMIKKCNQILKDEKYLAFIRYRAKKTLKNFRLDLVDDVVQEYFLNLCSGINITVEQAAFGFLRKEIKRGVVGKWNSDFSFYPSDALEFLKIKSKEMCTKEFVDYLIDIGLCFNEFEKNLIYLYVKGFTDFEVKKKIREKYKISNENFYKEKEKIFSNYGENYKRIRCY